MTPSIDRWVVAIGASAGGLPPLEGLLGAMPEVLTIAFVVVTHLSPDHISMLPDILGRATWMSVKAAEDGDRVAPGHVYVLPPNKSMTITGGCLRLRPEGRDHREHNPIDVFFTSLAFDQTDRAVGILLSGGGSDGTLGMKAIKEAGGIVMAQGGGAQGGGDAEPSSPSMPASAIAERLVGLASAGRLDDRHTVNQELSRKVAELDRANSDMRNLLSSASIATIFLDPDLVIRSFTPDAAQVFNLIGSDVGRPLTDIVNRLDYPGLRDDIRAVAEGGEPVERRIAAVATADAEGGHVLARLRAYRDCEGAVDGVVATFIDVTTLVEAEVRQRHLVAELNHRVKNMLAVVLALAMQTRKRATGLDDFFDVFQGRVQALSHTYELLAREQWTDIPLKDLIDKAMTPFAGGGGPIHSGGPDIILTPKAALSLGMVFHELTTNAVKHGALSTPDGRLDVHWSITAADAGPRVGIRWEETCPATQSRNPEAGFGIRLIDGELTSSLQGQVSLDFTDHGLVALMTFPARPAFVRRDPAPDTEQS